MGNTCCFCLQRERSVEDLLDGSLEDKLLGKYDDETEATTAEDEAWRQRREQLKDEEDMSMQSLNDDEGESRQTSLAWDLSDRNMDATTRKKAIDLIEDDEDDEAFGSAEESANDDDEYQETNESGPMSDGFNIDRSTQLTTRDSYASNLDSFRDENSQVFRNTEVDYTTDMSDTFLAPTSCSSRRDSGSIGTFLENETEDVHESELQNQEPDDPNEDENKTEKRQSSSSSRRSRTSKKKTRSKKSMRK